MKYSLPLLLLLCAIWLVVLYADLASERGILSIRSVIRIMSVVSMLGIPTGLGLTFIKKRRIAGLRTIVLSMVFSVFFISEFFLANIIWQDWTANTISAGNQLIVKLNEYYQEKAEYPDELVDLTPDYLDSLPALGYRYRIESFNYSTGDESFVLSFKAGNITYGVYDSGEPSKKWKVDTL